jgi:hypothetical protein
MASPQTEYRTTDTSLASYLITEGFTLLDIRYLNGDFRGTFCYEDSLAIRAKEKIYITGDVKLNLPTYERVRSGLLDRVKRGLP